jgi:hypothetical protein
MRKFYYDEKGYPRWKDTCELADRTVAAKMLGRPLEADEVVHHHDGDIKNFKKENLKVMKRKSYSRLRKKLQGHYKK